MDNRGSASRGLWLTIIAIGAAVVATITALIFVVADTPILAVAGSAAATFATASMLGITARKFVDEQPPAAG